MLDQDVFANEDQKVSGIAQRAVDHGYDALSPVQKHVLSPFMSHGCDGVENPGGHHNDCENLLTGSELESAYENLNYYDACFALNVLMNWRNISANGIEFPENNQN